MHKRTIIILAVIILVIAAVIYAITKGQGGKNVTEQEIETTEQEIDTTVDSDEPYSPDAITDIFGTELYLHDLGDNTYRVVTKNDDYEKKLIWDQEFQAYYDSESDCYLWYDVDAVPDLWRYWYKGISSDYGDYGWMEYEPDGWFIEESKSTMVELPSKYDSSKLWHIELEDDGLEEEDTEQMNINVETGYPIGDKPR